MRDRQHGTSVRGAGRRIVRRLAFAPVLVAAGLVVTTGVGGGHLEEPASAAPRCDAHASPSGRDSASGTRSRPVESVQALVRRLAPGETGCLAPGSYSGDVTIRRGGKPGKPVTIRGGSSPAVVRGRLWIAADDVRVEGLVLDGRNRRGLPSPTITGDRAVLRRNRITNNHTGICVSVGSTDGYGVATGTVIDLNRIHDCGVLPATNGDHGIYVVSARATKITRNVIRGNADRGVQLFPDSRGTRVEGNVIAGNGVGVNIGGWRGLSSSGNVVRGNVIAGSVRRANVESWWQVGTPPGSNNRVEHNCLWRGRQGNVGASSGLLVRNNRVANPALSRSVGFGLTVRGGRCAGLLERFGGGALVAG